MAGLHLTPEILESAYELLRTTPPFRGWKLPSADDVEFHVMRTTHQFAYTKYDPATKVCSMHLSHKRNQHLNTLLASIAHEMCHIRQAQFVGWYGTEHGAVFNRLADQVCRYHQFDRGAF